MSAGMSDSPLEANKMKYEWIKSEYDLLNKQIPAWSEADQKIIAVMATLVVGIIGLASSKYISENDNVPAYMLFLTSILMSFASIQSSLYSSLILLALERKVALSLKLRDFLNMDTEDIAMTIYRPDDTEPFRSYKQGVMPYILIRGMMGLILVMVGLLYSRQQNNDLRFYASFITVLTLSLGALLITVSHLTAFQNFLKSRPSAPKPTITSDPTIDPMDAGSWRNWIKQAPIFRPKSKI
ncbi:MAG: hypothetical protein K0Q54_5442 [Methylobacterium brachiatum]|nr:hypothetical protein [Methylobacterium brachiatum]